MYILGVDPGINAFGFAVLKVPRLKKEAIAYAHHAEVITADKKLIDWTDKVFNLMDQFDHLELASNRISHVYCECPRVMGGARGMAASGRGDVVHLAFHMGLIAAFARSIGASFEAVQVATWKGNLPDATVWDRVDRLCNSTDDFNNTITTHALDAVGIGVCGYYKTDMRDNRFWGK